MGIHSQEKRLSHPKTPQELAQVLTCQRLTQHHPYAYAHGPGYLDLIIQPDPFRRYYGARLIKLEQVGSNDAPLTSQRYWQVTNPASSFKPSQPVSIAVRLEGIRLTTLSAYPET